MEEKYYIYVYLDPTRPGLYDYSDFKFGYEPFYVGKGADNRINHYLYSTNKSIKEKVKRIRSFGYEPVSMKIIENLNDWNALKIEDLVIEKIGRLDLLQGPLLNKNKGKRVNRMILSYIKY